MSELEYFVHKRQVLNRHCREVGRDPAEVALSASVNIMRWGRDEKSLSDRMAAEHAAEMSEGERSRFQSSMKGGVRDPDECFSRLKAYIDEGATYVRISRASLDGIRLFAREVMPAIRAYASRK
jgi:hypothetical protein